MDPKIWGPHLWFFLHSMSFTYAKNRKRATTEEKIQMYTFLESLRFVLPCDVCKKNYSNYLLDYPPRLDSRKELFEWLVDLHNCVNGECKKSNKRLYTYDEVEKLYNKAYGFKPENK